VLAADAADDDPVFLHRDLDRPVTGPVLGVDRVVLDRRVQPEAEALLAVVEGALERRRARARAPAATAAAPPSASAALLRLVLVVALGSLGERLLGLGFRGLQLRGD